MARHKAVELTPDQAGRLVDILLTKVGPDGRGSVSRDWVGRDAAKIAAAIGLDVPADTRLLFVETDADHPFAVTELMMPVIPVIRAPDVDAAIDLAGSSKAIAATPRRCTRATSTRSTAWPTPSTPASSSRTAPAWPASASAVKAGRR
ncbi:hypothetical protein [Thauera sp. SDU_THAU2]|uniref:hypothetical protein n=1 Tax=Thauera sp. SDU_THAU2 TaxID=3136633 RepID=UPI00311D9961